MPSFAEYVRQPATVDDVLGMTEIRIDVQNSVFPLSPFTPDEVAKWDASYRNLFTNRNGVIRDLFEERKPHLFAAARAAKKALKERSFGAFGAPNTEIGMSPIRPGHVGFTTNAGNSKPNNVWRFQIAAATETNWIGAGTGTPLSNGQNLFLAPVGILELSGAPLIDQVKIDMGRSSLLPMDTHHLRVPDVPGAPNVHMLPLPQVYWGPNETVSYRVWSDAGGVSEPVLTGIAYGLGLVLNRFPTYTEAQRTE